MTPLGREWVRKAEADRRAIVKQRATPPISHSHVCNLSQQQAEKYLKALLHELGEPVAKTHDCQSLVDRLTSLDPTFAKLRTTAAKLNRFAVDPRYPGFWPNASESRSAVRSAERIRTAVRRRLGLRPRL